VEKLSVSSRPNGKSKAETSRKFDSVLLDVVDETLTQIFKEVGVPVIYASFEQNCQLKREDIPKRPDAFTACLEELLSSAAIVVEKLIVKNLYHRFGSEYMEPAIFSFPDRVKELKKMCASKEKESSVKNRIGPESQVSILDMSLGMSDGTNEGETRGLLNLYDSILKNMQVGLDIWCLENPDNSDSICNEHGLYLIEDNCDSLGSKYNGQYTGTFGDLGTLSFYPSHHMTTGEGGAVLTNNIYFKMIIQSLRDWGRDCYCETGRDNTCMKRLYRLSWTGLWPQLEFNHGRIYVYSFLYSYCLIL
jgi:hypothetical protein